jgi:hypothetical protein
VNDIIKDIKTQTNAVWEKYGWIIIASNLIFGLAFIFMVLSKKNEQP